jgi:hypothetical protein
MKTIYKYKAGKVSIQKGAKVLTCGCQNNEFYIWALVNDTEAELETREFVVYGTGWEITDTNICYVGTFFEGSFVWHMFEVM